MNNFNKIKPLYAEISSLLSDIEDIKPNLYREYTLILDNSINGFIDLGADYIENNPQEFEIFLKKLNDIVKILKFIKNKENIKEIKLINLIKEVLSEKKVKRDRCLRIADRKFDKPSAYKSGAVVRCRKGEIWKDLKEEELNENKINLTWEDFIKNVDIKELRDELRLDLNSFKELYIKTLDKLNKLKFPLKIYRALSIDDINKINYNNLGHHWTFNESSAEPYSGDYGKQTVVLEGYVSLQDIDIITTITYNLLIPNENEIYVSNPSNIKQVKIKAKNISYEVKLTEKQKETLRTWFKRSGAPGKEGGWVDCNSPIRKDGKITGYKPCGRKEGEKRSKYPSCRPTPAGCKAKGKGTKWGKTK